MSWLFDSICPLGMEDEMMHDGWWQGEEEEEEVVVWVQPEGTLRLMRVHSLGRLEFHGAAFYNHNRNIHIGTRKGRDDSAFDGEFGLVFGLTSLIFMEWRGVVE